MQANRRFSSSAQYELNSVLGTEATTETKGFCDGFSVRTFLIDIGRPSMHTKAHRRNDSKLLFISLWVQEAGDGLVCSVAMHLSIYTKQLSIRCSTQEAGERLCVHSLLSARPFGFRNIRRCCIFFVFVSMLLRPTMARASASSSNFPFTLIL